MAERQLLAFRLNYWNVYFFHIYFFLIWVLTEWRGTVVKVSKYSIHFGSYLHVTIKCYTIWPRECYTWSKIKCYGQRTVLCNVVCIHGTSDNRKRHKNYMSQNWIWFKKFQLNKQNHHTFNGTYILFSSFLLKLDAQLLNPFLHFIHLDYFEELSISIQQL